ncbi:MAG: type II secretion system protein [Phycisphaerales bacterium]
MKTSRNSIGGFTLFELLATIMVLSMIGMAMGPTLQKMRSNSRALASAANLQTIGVGGAMYASSNGDRLFSYSWRPNETYLMPNGNTIRELLPDAAIERQSQEILQRMTGRIFGLTRIGNLQGRIPQRRFNQLVLMDFLNEPIETTRYIDPADDKLLYWHANPLGYLDANSSVPYAHGERPDGYDNDQGWFGVKMLQRWTFSSSYQCVPSSWQPDFFNHYQPIDSTPHLYTSVGSPSLSPGRSMAEVQYPANKVWIHEEFDREQSPTPYFAYNHARAEKLMFDGSVNNWASGDASRSVGGRFYRDPWRQVYKPLDRFPLPIGGLNDPTLLNMRYRWTKGGLHHGVDYGVIEAPRNPRSR